MDDTKMVNLLNGLLTDFFKVLPNILGALVILFIGILLAKLLRRVIKKLIAKTKIDSLADKLNNIDIIHKSKFEVKPSSFIGSIVYLLLVLLTLLTATDVLNIPSISNVVKDIFAYVPNVVSAIVVLAVGIWVADMIKDVVATTLKSVGVPSYSIISSILFYFLFINVLLIALGQAKIDTGFLKNNISIILGGAVFAFALGYGLASKDTAANLMASFYSKDRLKIGDIIQVGGDKGEIININKTTVTLKSDDRQIVYPLKNVINEKIVFFNK